MLIEPIYIILAHSILILLYLVKASIIFHLNFILLLRYWKIHQSNGHVIFLWLVALKRLEMMRPLLANDKF